MALITGDGNGRRSHGRFDVERREMVELLRKRGIRDEKLLHVMESVERHLFVEQPFTTRAYDDSALPIGHSQTISQPYTVAFMTEALELQGGEKVLEIGTGSGYQAVVLAGMGARVFTIERNLDLLESARKRFDRMKMKIVSKGGDGTVGWNEYQPYDGIIVTAGAPEVPEPLLKQLKDGGRLVIPIGDLEIQALQVFRRNGTEFERREHLGFKFVPLIGKKGWT